MAGAGSTIFLGAGFLFSLTNFPRGHLVATDMQPEERGSMAQDDHVTVQEAAEYLRISVSTVYRLLRTGKLTGVKLKVDGEKGGLRVSRKLVFEFSDGQPKAASLE